jgi:hypothetical protein
MFDFLIDVPSTVAVDTVYKTLLQLVKYYRYKRVASPLAKKEELSLPKNDETSRLAAKIISEIENAENKRLTEFGSREIEYYARVLEKIAEKRVSSEVGYDPKLGQSVLESLRKQSAG